MRWRQFDGQGAACFEPDGRVRLFVNDEVAAMFAAAERDGVSADALLRRILDKAERNGFAVGTGPVPKQESIEASADFS